MHNFTGSMYSRSEHIVQMSHSVSKDYKEWAKTNKQFLVPVGKEDAWDLIYQAQS